MFLLFSGEINAFLNSKSFSLKCSIVFQDTFIFERKTGNPWKDIIDCPVWGQLKLYIYIKKIRSWLTISIVNQTKKRPSFSASINDIND